MAKLTVKQKKFIEAYEGNATEAARIAGYKGNDATLAQVGYENMMNPEINSLVMKRQDLEIQRIVMNRLDRQILWTELARSSSVEVKDRLKATELLGRSEGDFTEKLEVSVNLNLADRLMKARERSGK